MKILKTIKSKASRVMLDKRMQHRLSKIEKATGITLKEWQKEYVIDLSKPMPNYIRDKRGEGKTTAVIFRILLWETETFPSMIYLKTHGYNCRESLLKFDPDFGKIKDKKILCEELKKYHEMLVTANIKTFLYYDWAKSFGNDNDDSYLRANWGKK